MSLGPVRKAPGLLAAFGAAGFAFGGGADRVSAQQALAANVAGAAAAASKISDGDCAAFRRYVADEVKAFPGQFSSTFLKGVVRFAKAGCATHDADGEIQLITETKQDSISFGTSLRLMGKIDILSQSGIKHCHRPPDGVCPTQTGAVAAGPVAGGG